MIIKDCFFNRKKIKQSNYLENYYSVSCPLIQMLENMNIYNADRSGRIHLISFFQKTKEILQKSFGRSYYTADTLKNSKPSEIFLNGYVSIEEIRHLRFESFWVAFADCYPFNQKLAYNR